MVNTKKVYQKIFLGFSEGDTVTVIDSGTFKVKIIKIYPEDSKFSGMALVEWKRRWGFLYSSPSPIARQEKIGIKLLRP